MAFGQELKDFVSAFETGYKLSSDREEKKRDRELEERRLKRLEAADARAAEAHGWDRARFEEDYSPQAVETRRRALERQDEMGGFDVERARRSNTPEAIEREERAAEAGIEESEALADQRRESARALRIESDKAEERKKRIRALTRQRRGLPPEEDTSEGNSQAVPTSRAPEAAAPGPVSMDDRDYDLAVRTIIGEAGNQDFEGKQAVANVILNRAASGRYGSTVSDVVLARRQFEPWDTRKNELMSYTADDQRYQEAAAALEAATQQDVTGGATHFLNPDVVRQRRGGSLPAWAAEPVARIGAHAFYAPEGRLAEGSVGSARYAPGQKAIDDLLSSADGNGARTGSKADLAYSARDAVKGGLLFAANTLGLDTEVGVQTPDRAEALENYLEGEGAADEEDVKAAKKIVKENAPEDEEDWSLAEENLYTLAVTRDVMLAEGDVEGAERIAASLLQHYRQKSSQWLAIAKAAASEGDMDKATEAAAKAYAYIPDGREISVKADEKGYFVEVTDLASGQKTFEQLVPPDQMFAQIMQMSPADFDKQILLAAGQDPPKPKEGLSPALTKAVPEVAGMAGTEEANVYFRAQEQKAGRTGGGAKGDTFEEFVGGTEEGGGFREVLTDITTRGQVHEKSGKVDESKSIRATLAAGGATDTDIAEWEQGIENIAFQASQAGFTGDQRMLAQALIYATTDLSNTAPIRWDADQGVMIYKDAIKIPLTEDMQMAISAMRAEAAAAKEEALARQVQEMERQKAVQTQRAAETAKATEDEEYLKGLLTPAVPSYRSMSPVGP